MSCSLITYTAVSRLAVDVQTSNRRDGCLMSVIDVQSRPAVTAVCSSVIDVQTRGQDVDRLVVFSYNVHGEDNAVRDCSVCCLFCL